MLRNAVHVHPPMLRRACGPHGLRAVGQETEGSLLRIGRW
ncbi:hypothetical protein SLNWT_3714 [Streptomyces albus]|uniref:Uncharacterized protein n=1 Tax=Streptomyces albus (strain ATCC 21838 / DSM 41398 / FERM P-419 / JCM 4703 / NBRC 107858) TaxID=1081613 RepID=A0A0B5EXY0_STRA4|nr:hypothetical protein SLNWT_3714 [Streptomyces albus]AOU78395.1 hypothetical protein SLNHY_3704 [Streptomyces albus]